MQTDCSVEGFDFGTVEGRAVEAGFDAGLVTSDAGALLLGATDRAIGMMGRFAACFHDERRPELIEHEVATLVGQRVFGIALGYEDLNDHDELRHDPLMAVLAGKLEARREDCAPIAGKSTLNRLELSKLASTRYHKISHNPMAIRALLVDLFVEAHARPPKQIILDLDATDDPIARRAGGAIFPRLLRLLLLSAALRVLRPSSAGRQAAERRHGCGGRRGRGDSARDRRASAPAGRGHAFCCARDGGFAREDLMAWCEGNGVDFLFGLARNERLVAEIATELDLVAAKSRRTGRPERRFKSFMWTTRRDLEPPAPGRRQGRVDEGGSQSALRGHLAAARRVQGQVSLREGLLRPRRDGEPDQGVPARPLCGSHLGRHDAGQPAAPVVLLNGLSAALRPRRDRPRDRCAAE